MAKTKISEFSSTPGNNTDIDGINIAEGCAPSGINNAIRELMSQLKDFQAGTAGDSFNGPVGTTTAAAGAFTTLTTSSTVTHNAGTANGVAYLNGSKVLTTGSALTFDGTNVRIGAGVFQSAYRFSNFAGNATAAELRVDTNTGEIRLYGDTNYFQTFYANNSEQMRLTSTGLGIGTSSITQKLEINGNIRVNDGSTFFSQGALFIRSGSGGNLRFGANDANDLMILNTSGNLGLGVTPSAWAAGSSMDVGAQTSVHFSGSVGTLFGKNVYFNAGYKYKTTGTARAYVQDDGGHSWLTAPSGTAGNAISFTQAMTLDASGNLGVGTSSPTTRFEANTGAGGTQNIATLRTSNVQLKIGTTDIGNGEVYYNVFPSSNSSAAGAHIWQGGGTERARIDSSGNLLVGTTSGAAKITVTQSGTSDVVQTNIGSSGSALRVAGSASSMTVGYFTTSSGFAGQITSSGTTTSYATSSDYRLKENIQPMTGALAKVAALKPCAYKWKADGSDGEGFIAHELAEVVPQCVTGEKDAVDADGKPVYQGIDTSFLVATLTAAIQELKAEFDAYKATHP